MAGKTSPRLAEVLERAAPDDPLDVIVELRPAELPAEGTRRERMDAAREAFAVDLREFDGLVAEHGGEVLDSVWLNQTVRARLPAGAVEAVAADPIVVAVDLPRPLEADGQDAWSKPTP